MLNVSPASPATLRSGRAAQPSCQPAAGATQAVMPAAPCGPALPLREGDNSWFTFPRGIYTVFSSQHPLVCRGVPADMSGVSHLIVMRHTRHISRDTQRLPFRIYYYRFQSFLAARYFQQVRLPWQLWSACGCPPEFRPSVPWWHSLVYRWLVVTRWYPMPRRERRV